MGKLLPKNEEILGWKTHISTNLIYFSDHRRLSQSEENKCMWTRSNDGTMWVCSHTFTLFWSWKASVITEMCQVSVCLFHLEISSFFGNRFLFLILFIVLSVLWYFPFLLVSIYIYIYINSYNQLKMVESTDCENIKNCSQCSKYFN